MKERKKYMIKMLIDLILEHLSIEQLMELLKKSIKEIKRINDAISNTLTASMTNEDNNKYQRFQENLRIKKNATYEILKVIELGNIDLLLSIRKQKNKQKELKELISNLKEEMAR